jgi:hypothetical protein
MVTAYFNFVRSQPTITDCNEVSRLAMPTAYFLDFRPAMAW